MRFPTMPGNVISLIDIIGRKGRTTRTQVRDTKIQDWGEMPALLRAFYSGSIADRTELRAAQILSADMTVQDSAGQAP